MAQAGSSRLTFYMDKDKRDAFHAYCKERDMTANQALNEFVDSCVNSSPAITDTTHINNDDDQMMFDLDGVDKVMTNRVKSLMEAGITKSQAIGICS